MKTTWILKIWEREELEDMRISTDRLALENYVIDNIEEHEGKIRFKMVGDIVFIYAQRPSPIRQEIGKIGRPSPIEKEIGIIGEVEVI